MKTFCFVQLYHISEQGGGAEVQANFLARTLAQSGNEVHYICQSNERLKVESTSFIEGVHIHWLEGGKLLSPNSFKGLEEKIIKISPHFIIERMSSPIGYSIAKVKKKTKSKYIWICTDDFSPLPWKLTLNSYYKLPFLKFLLRSPLDILNDLCRSYAISKADIIFSQNKNQKHLIRKWFKRDSYKMISGHEPTITNKHKKDKTILWCANLGKHKRPEIFIDLAKGFEGSSYRFVMVGSHSDKNYLDELFKDMPINLEVMGKVSFKESLTFFDKSTVFVNTSSPKGDGFPNTYIQSWLRGIPVIAFGFDPDNIITKNNLGSVVNNVTEAKEIIQNLLNKEEKYDDLSLYIKKFAENNFTIDKMTQNFLDVLKNENFTLH